MDGVVNLSKSITSQWYLHKCSTEFDISGCIVWIPRLDENKQSFFIPSLETLVAETEHGA